MPKTHCALDLNESERGHIIGLKQMGTMSNRSIAKQIGCHHQTVANIYGKYLEKGNYSSDRQDCTGRPKVTTAQQDQDLVQHIRANPFSSVPQVIEHLALPCSSATAKRRLNEVGVRSYWSARKPFLAQRHADQRMAWCLQHLADDEDDWRKVLFTDESCVSSTKNGRLRVWRLKGERFTPDFITKVKRSGRFAIPVWGWMSAGGYYRAFEL
jgi:transposase